MIWLVSYPRSGNTFFRMILDKVYGIESSEYSPKTSHLPEEELLKYSALKTHLQPNSIPANLLDHKVVYLMRDGRDSVVSLAHHRIDIKQKKQSYFRALTECILGIGNRFDGGWSGHVSSWEERTDVTIKFEDLIKDPIGQVERLRAIMDLPEPNIDALPTFDQLKASAPKYGSGASSDEEKRKKEASKFYRKGKVGTYKDEMNLFHQFLFNIMHGKMLRKYYPKR